MEQFKIDPHDERPFFNGHCEQCKHTVKAYDQIDGSKLKMTDEYRWQCKKNPINKHVNHYCWQIQSCKDFEEDTVIKATADEIENIIPDFLNVEVYVVAARPISETNVLYFTKQTSTGISVDSIIHKATVFSKKDDADAFTSELKSQNTEWCFETVVVPRFVFGLYPYNGIK